MGLRREARGAPPVRGRGPVRIYLIPVRTDPTSTYSSAAIAGAGAPDLSLFILDFDVRQKDFLFSADSRIEQ